MVGALDMPAIPARKGFPTTIGPWFDGERGTTVVGSASVSFSSSRVSAAAAASLLPHAMDAPAVFLGAPPPRRTGREEREDA